MAGYFDMNSDAEQVDFLIHRLRTHSVSTRAGETRLSYFSRFFRKHMGKTPLQYRHMYSEKS